MEGYGGIFVNLGYVEYGGKAFFLAAVTAILFTLASVAAGDSLDAGKWFEKGQALARDGKMEEAVAAFDLAIEKEARPLSGFNAPELYYNRGLAYEGLENHPKAVDDFSKAIELNPVYAEAYFERGNAYFGQSFLWQAVRDYTKALDINPGMAKAYYTRGYAYMLLKDKDDGLADIKKAANMGHEPAKIFLKANGIEAK